MMLTRKVPVPTAGSTTVTSSLPYEERVLDDLMADLESQAQRMDGPASRRQCAEVGEGQVEGTGDGEFAVRTRAAANSSRFIWSASSR
jgi:hypothetical protein